MESKVTPHPIRLLQKMAMEDLSIEQAADRLHISVSTANQHLAKWPAPRC